MFDYSRCNFSYVHESRFRYSRLNGKILDDSIFRSAFNNYSTWWVGGFQKFVMFGIWRYCLSNLFCNTFEINIFPAAGQWAQKWREFAPKWRQDECDIGAEEPCGSSKRLVFASLTSVLSRLCFLAKVRWSRACVL